MMPFLVPYGLSALLTFSAALDPTLDMAWEEWKNLHGKAYLEGEEASRRATWEDNWRMIEQHNWEASQGKHPYRLGMNHFGDLTNEEFNQKMGCLLPDQAESATGNVSVFHGSATQQVPPYVNWQEEGYVTWVKDQGDCNSCWAFSATGALEALHAKKTRRLVPLSEQQLVDCSWDLGNKGCKYGSYELAFKYVLQNGGLSTEYDYPYEGKEEKCCENSKIAIQIEYIMQLSSGNEKALEQVVANNGPVSVSLQFGSEEFKAYQSGIFSGDCGNSEIRHAMLLVGYGEQRGRKYWILKNSWSEKWGEKGYMKLQKGLNWCGIADQPRFLK